MFNPFDLADVVCAKDNVLVANDGHAVVCDFGLSQTLGEVWMIGNATTTAASLRWQPPELMLSDEVRPTPLSDIWSFACTACEVCTRKTSPIICKPDEDTHTFLFEDMGREDPL